MTLYLYCKPVQIPNVVLINCREADGTEVIKTIHTNSREKLAQHGKLFSWCSRTEMLNFKSWRLFCTRFMYPSSSLEQNWLLSYLFRVSWNSNPVCMEVFQWMINLLSQKEMFGRSQIYFALPIPIVCEKKHAHLLCPRQQLADIICECLA